MREIQVPISLWPRQREALETDATELLFGGASSGGKSHFIRQALIKWCMTIPGLQCFIFRKHYDDVIGNHMEGPTGFRSVLQPLVEEGLVQLVESEVRFKFNGSLIRLEHCGQEKDLEKHQGREKHVLVFDEATQLPERWIKFLRAWVRMPIEMKENLPDEYKGKFPRIIYTANPIGASVGYFRRNFVKARPAFAIEKAEASEGGFMRQYIPSRVEDNLSEDPEAAKMRLSGMGDEALTDALLTGNWDAPVGDFFPEWNDAKHVVPDFTPPDYWFRYGAFDWGTTDPFCVYWIAVSDGESFRDENGKVRWFPRDSLIFYREWYGCDEVDPSKGLGMRNEEIADGIKDRCEYDYEKNLTYLTDSLPHQDRGGPTICEIFLGRGVILEQGDTNRAVGWSLLRGRLKGTYVDAHDKERTPLIFFTQSCKYARDYIPALPRHPNKSQDAADSGEATHVADTVRYGCASRPKTIDAAPPVFQSKDIEGTMTFDQAIKQAKAYKVRMNGTAF